MTAREIVLVAVLPLTGLLAAAAALAWRRRARGRTTPIERVELRLCLLEQELESPMREQLHLLDQLIETGDRQIAGLGRAAGRLVPTGRVPESTGRRPDLILAEPIEPPTRMVAKAPESQRRRAA